MQRKTQKELELELAEGLEQISNNGGASEQAEKQICKEASLLQEPSHPFRTWNCTVQRMQHDDDGMA